MTDTGIGLRKGLLFVFFFLCLAAMIAGVFSPGLNGPFVFDDSANIVDNKQLHLTDFSVDGLRKAAFSIKSGPLYRPVSMASLALNYYYCGLESFCFKMVNVSIHILNALLCVFFFYYIFLGAELSTKFGLDRQQIIDVSSDRKIKLVYAGLVGAAVWSLHPFNLTSVLYVVQRMNSLATFFTLLSLVFYCRARIDHLRGGSGWMSALLAFFVFFPLAVFSKENAALYPFYLFLIEWIIFKKQAKNLAIEKLVRFGYKLAIGLVVFLLLLVAMKHDWLLQIYKERDFTLLERVLTEPRVIWRYVFLIFVPNIQQMYLFHDDIVLSTGLLTPIETSYAIFGLIFLLIFAVLIRKKQPILSFAICFFFVGHSLESSVIALELAHEHRNYLPMIGFCMYIGYWLVNGSLWENRSILRAVLVSATIISLGLATTARSYQWRDWPTLIQAQAANNPASARSQYEFGLWYFNLLAIDTKAADKDEYYSKAATYLEKAAKNDPNDIAGLLALIRLENLLGKQGASPWADELVYRLENTSIGQPDVVHLGGLLKCQISGWCNLDVSTVLRLIESAKKNPSLAGRNRAMLYSDTGIMLFRQGNTEEGAEYLDDAVVIYPGEPAFWMVAMEMAKALGDAQKMDDLHEKFKERPEYKDYRDRVRLLYAPG